MFVIHSVGYPSFYLHQMISRNWQLANTWSFSAVRPLVHRLHYLSSNSAALKFGLKVGKLDFYRQISTSNPLIWFHLYDYGTGKPYKETTATSVSLPSTAVIDQFRKAVKAEYSDSHLKGIGPSDLLVFKNKDAFDKRDSTEEKVNHFIILQTGRAS